MLILKVNIKGENKNDILDQLEAIRETFIQMDKDDEEEQPKHVKTNIRSHSHTD